MNRSRILSDFFSSASALSPCGPSENRIGKTRTGAALLAVFLMLFFTTPAFSAEAGEVKIHIPSLTVSAGGSITVPALINKAEKLAGLKLVLHYDKSKLNFDSLEKGKKTNGLMHVVNSKTPGRLIVVMAGARGISGRDFPLFEMKFTAADTAAASTEIEIRRMELMGEDLKAIDGKAENGRIIFTAPEKKAAAPLAPAPADKAAKPETVTEEKPDAGKPVDAGKAAKTGNDGG